MREKTLKKTPKNKKPELLAPAGSFPMLVAAINAGADAVYFGLKEFSMRANAKNFEIKDLEEIQKICSKKNIKKYITLNTIIYDNEIPRIEKILKKIKKHIDAVICWDLSIIELCRKNKIPFHVSTQASIANTESARFYQKLGAERIVLARELNLNQIKKISKNLPKLGIECFIHGAMCVAVSGRCFTSQFLFNCSANRGRCIQPCRRTYTITDEENNQLKIENSRVMSAKDLCTLPFIEKIKKAGITSFKIEGRNRDARYVDKVVRIYRKALDNKLTKTETNKLIKELEKVYNRKFSSGFYIKSPTPDDFSDTENSSAKEKKHFIGLVTHYYDKIGVATIKLSSDIKLNDKIVIIGKTTGIIETKADYIESQKKPIKKASRPEEIGIKIPNRVRKNDEVYKIIKR